MIRKSAIAVALGVVSLGFAKQSQGSLVIGLQNASNGTSQQLTDTTAVGTVIPLTIVATITDTQGGLPANDSFQIAFGSILSTFGGGGAVQGNFGAIAFNPTFNVGAQAGKLQDIPGSAPGTDVGGVNSANSNTAGGTINNGIDYVDFRAATAVPGTSFTLGTVNFTVTAIAPGGTAGTTLLTWVPQTYSDGGSVFAGAVWKEGPSSTTQRPTTNSYTGASYSLSVTPEPGSLALAGLGSLGLLMRRRK